MNNVHQVPVKCTDNSYNFKAIGSEYMNISLFIGTEVLTGTVASALSDYSNSSCLHTSLDELDHDIDTSSSWSYVCNDAQDVTLVNNPSWISLVADTENATDACKKGVQSSRLNILKITAPNTVAAVGVFTFNYNRRGVLSDLATVTVLPICSSQMWGAIEQINYIAFVSIPLLIETPDLFADDANG